MRSTTIAALVLSLLPFGPLLPFGLSAAVYSPASSGISGIATLPGWDGGTNNIAAASTNTVSSAEIDVSEHDAIGVGVTLRPVSTSTGTVIFKFSDKVGSYYESTPTHTLTLTLNGTNAVTINGLYATAGLSGFALVQIVSTNAMAMTNVTIEVMRQAPKRRNETR